MSEEIMDIIIDPEIANLCPALSDDERAQLESNIREHGCRNALDLWGDVLLDGHNRLEICRRFGIDFEIAQVPGIETREQAINYVIDNQLGRRNLSPGDAAYLRGKRYNAEKMPLEKRNQLGADVRKEPSSENPTRIGRAGTAGALAGELGVHRSTLIEEGTFAAAVDAIAENVGPEAAREIRSGKTKITKSTVREIGKMPAEQQRDAYEKAKAEPRKKSSASPPAKPRKPKLDIVHDSDDVLAEQVCSLIHRLNEVSQKIDPETLYRKFPDGLRHNLDQALAGAAFFVSDLHALWGKDGTRKNAAG